MSKRVEVDLEVATVILFAVADIKKSTEVEVVALK